MRELIIESDIKLLSLNKAFVALRNGRRIRSKEYTKFSLDISRLVLQKRDELKAFNDSFNSKLHEIHAELIFYTNSLYTKDGKLSRKSGDLGNCEKCLTDCILIGSVDDSFITKWVMEKRYSESPKFKVTYKIIDRKSDEQ